MAQIQTEVLVIGGGATGTGVVRDLAMRGFNTVLVEKGDLAQGTTGRYHGLLHSGGRYAIKDPGAARECIEENRVLRTIMPHCIEDTGGFFVVTPWDEPEYAPLFLKGCQRAGIPTEELSIFQMLGEEPMLNPKITRCFRVPDCSADSFLAADANAESAQEYGARILKYHKVTSLMQDQGRVTGAECLDLIHDERVFIKADIIVNASGAWAGQIASLASVTVSMIPGKGVMLALNHRIVNTIINRCKMPADGDILVPAHTVSVIGTTDVKVEDPNHYAIEPWEVQLLLEEGEKLIPGFRDMRVLRAWAGVRPLYQDQSYEDSRDVTRAFVLLDHQERDGKDGFITITGGKWTTYRKMAEVTVDLVCKKLKTERACRTHLEILPHPQKEIARRANQNHQQLGERLKEIENQKLYGSLICECELATEEDVVQSILKGHIKTIDDIRRDVRLGMGPCQGGFCTYRVTGLLHRLRKSPVVEINLALHDFLQERWKGLLPILWGQQLRQERLNELIYLSLLNADHIPGPQSGKLSPEFYEFANPNPPPFSSIMKSTTYPSGKGTPAQPIEKDIPTNQSNTHKTDLDLLVIGAGLSGLAASWQAVRSGKRLRLISTGWGSLYWHTGCIDLLGYDPTDHYRLVNSPAQALSNLIQVSPQHPYALTGIDKIDQALGAFQELCSSAGYRLHGSIDKNWILPSALGASRPTCLAPEMMIAGDLSVKDPILVIGFEGYHDFYPCLIADNLIEQGIPCTGISLSLPIITQRRFSTGRAIAELFDRLEVCEIVAQEIKHYLTKNPEIKPSRLGFPAILGIEKPDEVKNRLENLLGLPIFEIPTLPPSIPGIRLCRMLVSAIENYGGRVFDGMQANNFIANHNHIIEIQSEAASRQKSHYARSFILATGGILGGGIFAEYDGSINEVVCNLPMTGPKDRAEWFTREFLSSTGHPIFQTGISVNNQFQPKNMQNQQLYDNLYIAGNLLTGGDYLLERSRDGVALATGYYIGKYLV